MRWYMPGADLLGPSEFEVRKRLVDSQVTLASKVVRDDVRAGDTAMKRIRR